MMRQERVDRDWTQEYVAKSVGVTQTAVQMLETAQRYPSYPVLVKLEDLFGKPHRELFAPVPDTPDPTPES